MTADCTGMKMVTEAEKNNIDWRLIPALAVRESTGGKHACKSVTYSPFGFGSCKIGFKSIDEAIEVVSKKLGGNDENLKHYKTDMTSEQILKKYNPDHIVQGYSKQVVRIMKMIDDSQEIA